MKNKNETLRGMTVVIMAVVLFVTLFAIPAPAANAAVVANSNGRYILSAAVTKIETAINGSINVHFVDENGEEWMCSYGSMTEIPRLNQRVTLIMNQNETPAVQQDDIIEDVLWSNETDD